MKTKEFGAWGAFRHAMQTAWGWTCTAWNVIRMVGLFIQRIFWPDHEKYSGHWLAKMVTFGCLGAILSGLTAWWLALLVLLVFIVIVHGSPYLAEDKENEKDSYIKALRQFQIYELEALADSKRKLMSQMVGQLYPSILSDEIRMIESVILEKKRFREEPMKGNE